MVRKNQQIYKMSLDSNFEIKRLNNEEDVQEIIEFIAKHYSFEEDLFGKIQGYDLYRDERVRQKLKQGWSFSVQEKSSKLLVAVMLCVVESKEEQSTKDIQNERLRISTTSELQAIENFFEKLEANFFELLSAERVFFPGMLTVHHQYRNRGLASFLFEISRRFAAEAGCRYVITTPTNDYLCSTLSKRGWKVLREINFKNYNLENEPRVFSKIAFPYTKAQLVCIESKTSN